MNNRCFHCHRAAFRACSKLSGQARIQALKSCSHMSEVDRYREAASCDGATGSDREQAIYIALKALCG